MDLATLYGISSPEHCDARKNRTGKAGEGMPRRESVDDDTRDQSDLEDGERRKECQCEARRCVAKKTRDSHWNSEQQRRVEEEMSCIWFSCFVVDMGDLWDNNQSYSIVKPG